MHDLRNVWRQIVRLARFYGYPQWFRDTMDDEAVNVGNDDHRHPEIRQSIPISTSVRKLVSRTHT
jgi:hypothetical protein